MQLKIIHISDLHKLLLIGKKNKIWTERERDTVIIVPMVIAVFFVKTWLNCAKKLFM